MCSLYVYDIFITYSPHGHCIYESGFKKKYTEQFVKSSILWETIDV